MDIDKIISLVLNVFLVFGAFAAIYVYRKQKGDERKSAATSVILEIRKIEEEIRNIKDSTHIFASIDLEKIYETTPIFVSLEWYKTKQVLVPKLKADDLKWIEDFYKKVIVLEDARLKVKMVSESNKFEKIAAINNKLAEIAFNSMQIDTINDEQKRKMLDKCNLFNIYYNSYGNEFVPEMQAKFLFKAAQDAFYITGLSAFKEIIKIAKMD